MSTIATRPLGDVQVSAIGMGAMTITQVPDYDEKRGVRAVHAALDAGVTLFDTADSYGPSSEMGVNESALAAALRSHPGGLDDVIVATKGGHTRGENASWWLNGSPDYLARAARASLARLGFDALPLYQLHRPDPRVPFVDSLGGLRQLVDDGIARRVGVSNVSPAQLTEAIEALGSVLVSVQNEFSPIARDSREVMRLCEQNGLAFLAWGPLGGMRAAKDLGSTAAAFDTVARSHGVSPQRIAIAWILHCSPCAIPIPGASRPESVLDSVAAATISMSAAELELLEGCA